MSIAVSEAIVIFTTLPDFLVYGSIEKRILNISTAYF